MSARFLFISACNICDNIGTFFDSEKTAVKTEIIIMAHTPFIIRIISVICLIVIWLFSLVEAILHSENINKNSHIEKKEVKTPRELYEEAIKYKNGDCVAKNNQQAINIFKRILNIKDAFNNRKLIGDVYNQLGVIAEEEYNYNEGMKNFDENANGVIELNEFSNIIKFFVEEKGITFEE